MRRKDQGKRRAQLAEAARQVLLQRGAVGLRVKDIAARAGMSPSTLLYYYPEVDDLLLEVARTATDRFADNRARAVRELAEPIEQLRLAIHLGIPTGPDDEESRLLYELDALTGASTAFAALSTSYFDRQVALYESVLTAGSANGSMQPTAPVDVAARGLVALEDGLGLQVVLGHPSIDSAEAERVLSAYAQAVAGAVLG
ncbi:MAG TPA: TetR/AcrR family transcriptional regulator [Solirubrobacterales bacterium]|nr:TetR/AcrR family transcriptional regulator [Solirubrobacterales bacterium]